MSIINEVSKYLKKEKKVTNILGNFKIKKQLGQGGTSIVKLAILENTDQEFAIKFLIENIKDGESTAFKRFKQAHINILLIQNSGLVVPQIHFDTLEINKEIIIPYIIMKKAKMTLKEYITQNKIPYDFFKKIFYSLLNTIELIHKKGIIHRDLKPENIFIIDDKLVLGDFDISKFDDIENVKLIETRKGERLANYLFSAPEQSDKSPEEITPAADWYAFGQIIYWLLYGKTLRGQSRINFASFGKDYILFGQIVQRLLLNDPSARFQSKDDIMKFINEKDKEDNEARHRIKMSKSFHLFDDIIYKYMSDLGMSGCDFRFITNEDEINDIITYLQKNANELNLWLSQGYSDCNIKSINKQNDSWLFGIEDKYNNEIKIKSIIIYKHRISYGGSFLIFETDHLTPSGIYEHETEIEEIGIYNNNYIRREEYDTGWAVINGKRTKLDDETELRVRYLQPTIFFVAPKYGPLVENAEIFDAVYKQIKNGKRLDIELLQPLKKIKRTMEARMYD